MHHYEACGLAIASDAPIAGLRSVAGKGVPDLTMMLRGLRSPAATIEAQDYEHRVVYDDAAFLVDREGHHVVMQWASPSVVDTEGFVTASVLPFVLRVRGSLPLHASAVVIDGRAVLFIGDSWAGKSSTAAAFSTLGYSLLSDDLVRIDICGGDAVAYPFDATINVWGDSAAVVFGSGDGDAYRKRQIDVVDSGYRFHATPAPIIAVYVLGQRTVGRLPVIRGLAARDAFIALVSHMHGGRLLDGQLRAREFDLIARVVERVPVRELTFGDSLDDLVSSCRIIADNYA